MNNQDTQTVLTYNGIDRSHPVGEEEYTISVAGRSGGSDDVIRCVFSQGAGADLTSFCNIVSAKSSLINVKIVLRYQQKVESGL
jgi:hypothetical protein